jgi:hypothetical protein
MRDVGAGFFLCVFLILVMVVGYYNCWSYSSGRCTAAMMMDMGPVAFALILCNLAAFLLLLFMRVTRTGTDRKGRCACGTVLISEQWKYCPECGQYLLEGERQPSGGK